MVVLLDEAEGTRKEDIPPWDDDAQGSGSDDDDENDPPAKQCVACAWQAGVPRCMALPLSPAHCRRV